MWCDLIFSQPLGVSEDNRNQHLIFLPHWFSIKIARVPCIDVLFRRNIIKHWLGISFTYIHKLLFPNWPFLDITHHVLFCVFLYLILHQVSRVCRPIWNFNASSLVVVIILFAEEIHIWYIYGYWYNQSWNMDTAVSIPPVLAREAWRLIKLATMQFVQQSSCWEAGCKRS